MIPQGRAAVPGPEHTTVLYRGTTVEANTQGYLFHAIVPHPVTVV